MNEYCTACGKRPRKPGFKRCNKCVEYFRNNRKKRNIDKCSTCGGPLDSSKKTCLKCLDQKKVLYINEVKEKRKKIKVDRKKENICINCGKSECTNLTFYCEDCLNKFKNERKIRRDFWIRNKLCTNCGNPRENSNLRRCVACNHHRKRSLLRRKMEVLRAYGHECYCCGLNQLEFLTIDHINGGGSKHRKQITSLYGWLKKNNYPDGHRTACINCNLGRSRNNRDNINEIGGLCPHQDNQIKNKNFFITPYTKNRLLTGKSNRKSDIKLRLAVIDTYGGKCQCCDNSQYEFLSMDHIMGGGREHTSKIKGTIYTWAKKNNYPSDLRILCLTCNLGRQVNGGKCPHKCEKKSYDGFSLTKATYESLIWTPS